MCIRDRYKASVLDVFVYAISDIINKQHEFSTELVLRRLVIVSNKRTIEALNQLLQGEYMAVESFNNFISRLEEGNVKQAFIAVSYTHLDVYKRQPYDYLR